MGVKNTYYLVGRSFDNSKYHLFPDLGNQLEEIDCFTLGHDDIFFMGKELGFVGDDYYIFSYNNKYYRIFDVVNSDCYELLPIIRDDFHDKNIEKIYHEFCYKMKYSLGFSSYVLHSSSLYPKFVEYFKKNTPSANFLFTRDGGWVKKSYPLIHGVVSSMHLYPNFDDYTTERRILTSQLIEEKFSNTLLGQVRMFETNGYSYDEIFEKDGNLLFQRLDSLGDEDLSLLRNVSFEIALLLERLHFYRNCRDQIILKKLDSSYYDAVVSDIEEKLKNLLNQSYVKNLCYNYFNKRDVDGYQYQK